MVGTSLPRHAVGVALSLREEHLLDFVVDADEPCLGARGAIAKVRSLSLGVPQSFFGCAKLNVLRMREVETKAYERDPWRVCSLRSPCRRLSAARPRSSARSHRPRRRYPVALLAWVQTGQSSLLYREHTHSLSLLRP